MSGYTSGGGDVVLYDPAGNPISSSTPGDSLAPAGAGLQSTGLNHLFNGLTWDRERNNSNSIVALPSAERSVSTESPLQINYNAKGCYVFFSITAVPSVDTVQLRLQIYDDVGLASGARLLQSAALAAPGFYMFFMYPGVGPATLDLSGVESRALPRNFLFSILHSAGTPFTYSVNYALVL